MTPESQLGSLAPGLYNKGQGLYYVTWQRLLARHVNWVSTRYNRLSIKIIKALACLKLWYKLKEFMLDEDLLIGPKIKDQE
jgi:hypothetical protein